MNAPSLQIVWRAAKLDPVAQSCAGLVADYVEQAWDRKLQIEARVEALDAVPTAGAINIMSMTEDVHRDDDLSKVALTWRDRLIRFKEAGEHLCVLLTLFRGNPGNACSERLNRIRQLNLLVIELSRTHGVEIADIDQACALIGAEHLGCDYLCTTPAAQRVVQYVVGSAVLNLDISFNVIPELSAVTVTGQRSLMQFVARELQEKG